MSLTIESVSATEALDKAYKSCLETHKKAPKFYEMGPHELRAFQREVGMFIQEYKGIPIRPIAQAGINYQLH